LVNSGYGIPSRPKEARIKVPARKSEIIPFCSSWRYQIKQKGVIKKPKRGGGGISTDMTLNT
jgi:hypothetical protein